MTQEEKIIRAHDSGRRPFTVPEGYFEGFTERMMARLAAEDHLAETVEQQPHVVKLPLWRRSLRYAAAAAAVALCVGGAWLYTTRNSSGDSAQMAAQMEMSALDYSEEDINAILDYELVDNQHIAYYLTEAY
ncbi:MAG: hypothetical protein IJ754_03355 [Bacteroidaceae bacterium]|nr:hypothetical protein [Bacteroidaceae bacterium]MBR1790776.1 hypothetical protein [Bacteroidaceae bacterium]